MMYLGLVVTLLGFFLSLLSLSVSTAVGVRMAMTIAGILVSLLGIIGLINPSFVKNAIWKR